ncbi:MAG: [Fe-Fe] hydrogenase large subunit C-terminal domain-containing protein, partial [Bacteroidota bacterium]
MKKQLTKIIDVNKDKCINCHACILACPVKYCNDGSGDHVNVNFDLCIGCGSCLVKCTHNARIYLDDFSYFLKALEKGEKVVAIVAPSVAANFPDKYLNLNGWFKSIGIEAVFDVSFGAELTVYSYLNYIKEKNPKLVIAQPCPAIVTYLEIYKPELLEYLVPVDSPMLHTMKMIKHFYPKYKNHKIAVISPCTAKKREFDETGYGDFNVAYKSLDEFLKTSNIDLNNYEPVDYDNPPAERAVLFSSPGGLMQTAERWVPEIRYKTRKIEGTHTIYNYLKQLPEVIELGTAPLLIDCLNCENGCNAGSLTLVKDKSIDEIEFYINKRNLEQQNLYLNSPETQDSDYKKVIENLIKKYWKENLYTRNYINLSENNYIKTPTEVELWTIYNKMKKYSQDDILNCTSCGYEKCESMATAIFNNLNRPENCHFYLHKEAILSHEEILKSQKRLRNILESTSEGFIQIDNNGNIIEANPTLKQMFGEDDIVGKSAFDFLDEKNKEIFIQQLNIRNHQDNGKYELEIKSKNGEKIYCLISATNIYDDDGKKTGSFGMISNITDLKKAEQTIQNSEKKFRTLFEYANFGIFLLRNELIIECNKKGLEMFGCSTEQMIGMTLLQFSPENQPDGSDSESKLKIQFDLTLANKQPTFYWVLSRKNKTEFDSEISLAKIVLSGETFIQVIIR